MARNPDRTARTRTLIISAARTLFGKHGYGEVSTPQIADAASVSRGAMYHHFKDKAAILEAVIEAEYARIARFIDKAARGTGDPVDDLVEGGDAFLSAMSDPVSRQLLLIDGPAVLGMVRMNQIDTATTTRELALGIKAAQAAGRLPGDIDAAALTSLMTGAYDRGAIDGFAAAEERRLAVRHAIRAIWFGLSKLA
ncbi:TetR/AcrR family transcriptional regulator [Henriciella mobilis]|uniref:TetR/AcrR family transcriptional regulator n=1 Tax=Henriciella mobilis TaxID=2305467 RepID=A0A399REW4_9PROT|nr:TetR/AcrR family transcriptional regulator [Henriciella mobilis]RIJ28577.1 TetR/AcrR family transcriptional regulator [Henriciella mobilis]